MHLAFHPCSLENKWKLLHELTFQVSVTECERKWLKQHAYSYTHLNLQCLLSLHKTQQWLACWSVKWTPPRSELSLHFQTSLSPAGYKQRGWIYASTNCRVTIMHITSFLHVDVQVRCIHENIRQWQKKWNYILYSLTTTSYLWS